ncbi:DNA internalization-related competence protein ComEC/Rec2 [Candidatus Desulfarcum epimagneticum]|uniref:DNA internalization-related competence protein ComEC/Rec2 n=1 Tax=uncultured Desulfobacteraceae bacterium TaxID=218296 RepID=A0A484HMF0_9BACT|nr:DNA internalization-related competence protein ComEC/Rec2 [uncultured Desulfobacteraceae bacterium]
MRPYRRPVVPLVFSLAAGIVLGHLFPTRPVWPLAAAGVFFFMTLAKTVFKKNRVIEPLLLFAALGHASISPFGAPNFPDGHVVRFVGKAPMTVIAGVKEVRSQGRRASLIVEAEKFEKDRVKIPARGRIRLTVYGAAENISPGDLISFKGRLFKIKNFANPFGFDYQSHMAFKRIWVSSHCPGKKIKVLEKRKDFGPGAAIGSFRRKIAAFIDREAESRPVSAGILKAVTIGDRTGISPHVREAFNRAGAGHLLAISGLHIGIIATLSFFVFTRLLWRFRRALLSGRARQAAAILSLVPVISYAAISGMSPSAQRAMIMAAVVLFSLWAQRRHEPFNALALAAFAMLILSPQSLFSISFRLSFAAVFAILWGFSHIRFSPAPDAPFRVRAARWSGAMLAASFFAILGTLPWTLFYFSQVSVIGIATNFVLIPLVGFLATPLGLLAVFFHGLGLFGDHFFLSGALGVLDLCFWAIESVAALPFAAVETIGLSYFEIFCFYALLGSGSLAVFAFQEKDREKKKKAAILAAGALALTAADVSFWAYDRLMRRDFRATFLDVGQGNAALLEFPRGFRMLVDGGGFRSKSGLDTGRHMIAPLLRGKKIGTIDAILLSHPDSDHLNGLIYIAERFNVKSIWTNGEKSGSMSYRKLTKIIRDKKIEIRDLKTLPRTLDIQGVRVEILYPPDDFLKRKKKEKWRNRNNNSLVARISLGSFSALFPGDIMEKGEKELCETAGDALKSAVLLAPHHGAATSSTEMFVKKVSPETVVISSGRRYGRLFSRESVSKRYQRHGADIFRTDTDGAVMLKAGPDHWTVHARNKGRSPFNGAFNEIREAFGLCF